MNLLNEVMGNDEELLIRDSKMSECEELQRVYDMGAYLEKWVGEPCKPDYIYKQLTEGQLPPVPNAKKEYFGMKSIYLNKKLIGILEIYHGYPSEDVLWIGYLFFNPEYQSKGYGQRIVELVSDEAWKCGFNKIGIGVHLKNWPALRFWTKAGFDRVTKVTGDRIHREDTYAIISLEKNINAL